MSNPSTYYRQARAEGLGFYYDPLYGFIPLNPLLRQAIDLPEVQRLRHLNQLAVLSLVFPGATHTRFAHSIGLSYLCDIEYNNLFRLNIQQDIGVKLTSNHLLALQLAAIFHDVGHGPFSHIFEMFCKRYQRYKEYTHEEITRRLITEGIEDYTHIPRFLEEIQKKFKEDGVSSEELELLTPESIANIVQGKPPVCDTYAGYAFLGQLLHSPYDIDRLDYLRRDAYYTGVEIGSVDIWEIIHNFLIYKDESKDVWMLGVDIKAAEAIEALLIARDLAYRKVYYNQTHRSNQELIIRGLLDLVESRRGDIRSLLLKNDYEIIEEFVKGDIFTKEIADRLKTRRLYEPLPISLNLDSDFDDNARVKRIDLWKKEYKDVMSIEEKLSKDLSIWGRNTIIFDYETVPLAKDEDYKERFLFDKNQRKNYSLLEALPHLELIYGIIQLPSITHNLGDIYRNRLSNFFVYVPYELIEKTIEEMNKKIQDENIDEDRIDSYIENECNDVIESLNIICDNFVTLVEITGEQRTKILRKFRAQIISYLKKLLKI